VSSAASTSAANPSRSPAVGSSSHVCTPLLADDGTDGDILGEHLLIPLRDRPVLGAFQIELEHHTVNLVDLGTAVSRMKLSSASI
jgi:hypothetical protein